MSIVVLAEMTQEDILQARMPESSDGRGTFVIAQVLLNVGPLGRYADVGVFHSTLRMVL